ncbi:doublecortin domain-containing protein 2C [Discoglossus pictus]
MAASQLWDPSWHDCTTPGVGSSGTRTVPPIHGSWGPPVRLAINRRKVQNFEALLAEVTQRVKLRGGAAVRCIYTPNKGHRVERLEAIQSGQVYVAAGKERFQKLDYIHINNKRPSTRKEEKIKPVVHSSINVPSRWAQYGYDSIIINVFTNGATLMPPLRILIPKNTVQDLNRILSLVTEKVNLRSGAVQRLYTVDGNRINNPKQLESNQYYVAVGKERFRQLPYLQWIRGRVELRLRSSPFNSLQPLPRITNSKEKSDYGTTGSADETPHCKLLTDKAAYFSFKQKQPVFYTKSTKSEEINRSKKGKHQRPEPEYFIYNSLTVRPGFNGEKELKEASAIKMEPYMEQVRNLCFSYDGKETLNSNDIQIFKTKDGLQTPLDCGIPERELNTKSRDERTATTDPDPFNHQREDLHKGTVAPPVTPEDMSDKMTLKTHNRNKHSEERIPIKNEHEQIAVMAAQPINPIKKLQEESQKAEDTQLCIFREEKDELVTGETHAMDSQKDEQTPTKTEPEETEKIIKVLTPVKIQREEGGQVVPLMTHQQDKDRKEAGNTNDMIKRQQQTSSRKEIIQTGAIVTSCITHVNQQREPSHISEVGASEELEEEEQGLWFAIDFSPKEKKDIENPSKPSPVKEDIKENKTTHSFESHGKEEPPLRFVEDFSPQEKKENHKSSSVKGYDKKKKPRKSKEDSLNAEEPFILCIEKGQKKMPWPSLGLIFTRQQQIEEAQ